MKTAQNPTQLFAKWFQIAKRKRCIVHVNAAALATANGRGRPSNRIVLIKAFGPKGFIFYTNYQSHKALDLSENPFAALCFHWEVLDLQVRIEGRVKKVPRAVSEKYFSSRPRGSQIGAWVSQQSCKLKSRQELEAKVREIEKRFQGIDIPIPEFWGGYLLEPNYFEFWKLGENRLHDRLTFTKKAKGWKKNRLWP